MKSTKANRLVKESSPYLLQHAYNPVDWYPWGEEALQRAVTEDKPILVSIGYAACHWCHVMERESFEDEQVAELMNRHYICIKIDREERPDIDHIYMDALQAISGQGGWPLNMFLTPEGKPFYGGTYFPPRNVHGRPSWSNVLRSVHEAFISNREAVNEQADSLTRHITQSDNNLIKIPLTDGDEKRQYSSDEAHRLFNEMRQRFDKINGGFGGAPKFPNTLNLQFLLRYYYHTANQESLDHVVLSLTKMSLGGIYDHLGGGFARYSVDAEWLAPHFEKMLYDNALLVTALSEAYQITREPLFKQRVYETLAFVAREMTSVEGGFYAALDADSEGVEGKFYTWSYEEIKTLLGDDAKVFCNVYGIQPEGNWEGVNILHLPKDLKQWAKEAGEDFHQLQELLAQCRAKLFNARSQRVRPGLDDKILLGWNALMCSAYCKAYETFGEEEWLSIAQLNMAFMLQVFVEVNEHGQALLYHTYKDGSSKYPGFLDDYAFLAEAMLDLYQASHDERLIGLAAELVATAHEHFYDEHNGFFFYTPDYQTDVVVRKKELFDGVTPSGNATMAAVCRKMGVITGNTEFSELAERMLLGIKDSMLKFSFSFSKWASLMLTYIYPPKEIAIVGLQYDIYAKEINRYFLPDKIQMASAGTAENTFPLFQNRLGTGNTLIYLCVDYTCSLPFKDVESFRRESGIFLDTTA
ncbi:MAG: thioredoxin domain-containing protein [Chitinophagales bacterium]|nr:thioredoxin domain-containing protein [Chitinophagales bacterium]